MIDKLKGLTRRSGTFATVTPRTSVGPYQEGQKYKVTVDRMTCNKLCIYFTNSRQEGANKSYLVFEDESKLSEKFKGAS